MDMGNMNDRTAVRRMLLETSDADRVLFVINRYSMFANADNIASALWNWGKIDVSAESIETACNKLVQEGRLQVKPYYKITDEE